MKAFILTSVEKKIHIVTTADLKGDTYKGLYYTIIPTSFVKAVNDIKYPGNISSFTFLTTSRQFA